MDGHTTGFSEGWMAVLQGDPSKEGEFTVRLSMPANYKISQHWHPTTENVTVVKGDFYLGTGDKFDENSATLLNTGGFASIPATHHHFAFTKAKLSFKCMRWDLFKSLMLTLLMIHPNKQNSNSSFKKRIIM